MTTAAGTDRLPEWSVSRGGLLVGRIRGVPILLVGSWWISAVILIATFAGVADRQLGERSPGTALALGITLPVIILVLVLAQQLAEAAVATRIGIDVVRIRLFMPSGTVDYASKIATPRQDALVALAGPAVPLAVAAVFCPWWALLDDGSVGWLLVGEVGLGAVALALFALLPGVPLPGGRLLRAGIWRVTDRRATATTIGLTASGVVATVMLIWGLAGFVTDHENKWFQLGIAVVGGWFLVSSARAEAAAEAIKPWPDDVPPASLARPLLQLAAETPVEDALRVASGRGVLLVRPDGVAVGLLDQVSAQWLLSAAPSAPAERASEPIRAEAVFSTTQSGQEIAQRIATVPNRQFLLVGPDRRPVGMIYREDLHRVLDIREEGGSPARWDRPGAQPRW